MFMTGMLSGTLYNTIDPTKERRPPPQPTPVTFPTSSIPSAGHWDDVASLPDFQRLFSSITKPSDVSEVHDNALNVQVEPACAVDRLAPSTPDREPDDPSPSIELDHGASPGRPTLTTAAKLRKEFDECIAELGIDHNTAFRVLARTLPPGTPAPRLAHMRKFFTGLESMSAFWDCSLDEYYEVSPDELGAPAKRQRIDPDPTPPKVTRGPFNSVPIENDITRGFTQFQATLPHRQGDGDRPDTSATEQDDDTLLTSEGPVARYKGRRTGTGRDMPDSFRIDTVRAFVEGACMPFFCTVAPPRQIPIVRMAKLSVPVRQTAAVYKLSKDRAAARQGRIIGPVLGLQVRAETDFVDTADLSLADKSRLDALRELGVLLQLAQERCREGKSEIKPGEGKWWTTVPRWGGAENNHNPEENSPTDEILAVAEELVQAAREKRSQPSRLRLRKNRKTAALAWKELKCGAPLWDSRTEYKAIGKRPGAHYDEIYMVSSLNHHISILKLTVHDAYLDALTNGTFPQSHNHLTDSADGTNDHPWYRPKLERSHWYDLFDSEQRLEAFRGLWKIMSYLTHDMEQPAISASAANSISNIIERIPSD